MSRAMAARMAEQGVDHLWLDATGLERFSAALPDHCGVALLHRPRPPVRLVADRAGGPPPLGRRGDRPVGCHGAARAVGGGGGGLHRGARRQPAGLQLAARGHGVRCPPGRAHPVRCAPGPEASGALRAVLGEEPIDGIGCTVLVAPATPPPPDPERWPGVDVTKLRDTVQRAMTRGAGVVRSAESLAGARAVVEEAAAVLGRPGGVGGRRRAGQPAAAGRRAAGLGPGPHREPGGPRPARVPRPPSRRGGGGSCTAASRRAGADRRG